MEQIGEERRDLIDHRLAERRGEFREAFCVGVAELGKVGEAPELRSEIGRERTGPRIAQQAPRLGAKHGGIAQRARFAEVLQFIVGNARPEEETETRREFAAGKRNGRRRRARQGRDHRGRAPVKEMRRSQDNEEGRLDGGIKTGALRASGAVVGE